MVSRAGLGASEMKLLRETYKTWEGASKRCGFENGIARHEYERGYKARHYHYSVVEEGANWRVRREIAGKAVI